MAISLLSNLSINSQLPDVTRMQFDTIEDMKNYREQWLPQMYDSFCLEDSQKYRFNKSNSVDPITGKWRVIGEGGGGDLSSYYTKTQTDTLLTNKVDKVVGKDLSTNDYTDEEKAKLADLENYDDTALANRVTANEDAITILNGNTSVNGSVDKKVATCLSDSKSYTDTSIQNAIKQTAIVCDAKPTLSGTTITYYQDGVEKTITSDNKTKFYYTTDGTNYSTIFIERHDFTDTIASVDFADYVSKTNDVISTYTGSEADKTKIPNIASMDALKALVDTDLNDKMNVSDVESSVSSSSDNPVKSSALYTEFAKKVDIDQGSNNEGKVLKVNSSGNLVLADPSAIGTDASGVEYTNASYPSQDTVKKALDAIWNRLDYKNPEILTFTMTPSTTVYEVGQTVSELVFNWTYNKDVTEQTLTDCTLADETVRTATYSTAFTTNKTFTLNATDSENSVSKNLTVQFQNKVYWGSAEIPQDYNSTFILGLSNSKFSTSYKSSYNITVANNQYGFICCPASWNIPSECYIGGFLTTLVKESNIAFTNSSGSTVTYSIVRTSRSGLGSITMEFK